MGKVSFDPPCAAPRDGAGGVQTVHSHPAGAAPPPPGQRGRNRVGGGTSDSLLQVASGSLCSTRERPEWALAESY